MAFVYAEQASWNSRKSVALMVAVAVNVGFLAAMHSGLTLDLIKPPPPLTLVPVPPDPAPPEPEPIPKPPPFKVDLSTAIPPPVLNLPPIEVDLPPIADPPPFTGDESGAAVPPVPVPQMRQLRVIGPLTPPVYPAIAMRLAEQGTVRLLIYVLPDGTVGDVKVHSSSGYPRLDKAAMTAARKYWSFEPATQGGTPIAAWGYFAVTFKLVD